MVCSARGPRGPSWSRGRPGQPAAQRLAATVAKVEYAQDYAWEKIAKQIVGVYEELV
jgi:hypothetical protein